MSHADHQPGQDEQHQRIAAEVLELGAALFDVVIDAATAPTPVAADEAEAFPADDVRAAADQFFTTLRRLLKLEPSSEPDVPPQP